MDRNLLVGVDIGGTKTRILGRRGDTVLFDKTVITDEWRIRQMEADALKLSDIVLD
ncbi:MAG: ATPase, partial [Mesorhizobium sp.]